MKNSTKYIKVASHEAQIGEFDKVLLLYSGGLDTSVMLKWIKDNYHAEVYTLTLDIGQQKDDLKAIQQKALKTGAKKAIIYDAKDEFADLIKRSVEECNNELYLKNDPLDETYAVLNNMKSVILDNQGKGDMRGILLDSVCPSKTIEMGEYSIKANLAEGKKPGIAGVLIIQTDKREFIVAGKGLDLFFIPRDTSMRVALDLVDEGSFKNGSWVSERRLNGDETHASTWSGTGLKLPSQKTTIQKVTLYHYK